MFKCKKMEEKKTDGGLSRLEYLSWFLKHEPNCYLNHDGSSVSILKSYHQCMCPGAVVKVSIPSWQLSTFYLICNAELEGVSEMLSVKSVKYTQCVMYCNT